MPKEPKVVLSLTPEASACAKDHLENAKQKGQEAYMGSPRYSLLGLITFVYSIATWAAISYWACYWRLFY